MSKFDPQISDIKSRLQTAQKVLVVLPQQINVDKLGAGLALYLALKGAGKNASIVSEATTQVLHGNLFGVGEVKNQLPQGNGNFIVSLDGVVDNTGSMPTVPALEKLDWYPENQTLNLVFHVVPGQRFEPTKMASRYENSGFDLIFVLGTSALSDLGALYTQNSAIFSQTPVVNIDLNPSNGNYGAVNIVGTTSATISEIVMETLTGASLPVDQDIATNILIGIYDGTNNLSGVVSADTFLAASQAMQAGGNIPQITQTYVQTPVAVEPQTQVTIENTVVPTPEVQVSPQPISQPVAPIQSDPVPSVPSAPSSNPLEQNPFLSQFNQASFQIPPVTAPIEPAPVVEPTPVMPVAQAAPMASASVPVVSEKDALANSSAASGFDLRQVFQIPPVPGENGNSNQKPVTSDQTAKQQDVPSPEERPMGEYVSSPSPEMDSQPTPDWLVPKIFKSGNLG